MPAAGDVITVNDAENLVTRAVVITRDGVPWTRGRDQWVNGVTAKQQEFLGDEYPPASEVTVAWLPPVPDPVVGGALSEGQLDALPAAAIVIDMEGSAAQRWEAGDQGYLYWTLVGDDAEYTTAQMIERCDCWRLVWTREHQAMLVFASGMS